MNMAASLAITAITLLESVNSVQPTVLLRNIVLLYKKKATKLFKIVRIRVCAPNKVIPARPMYPVKKQTSFVISNTEKLVCAVLAKRLPKNV